MDINFPWGHERRWNDYSNYIKQKFGQRVQKIAINAGFSCPNRDGTIGIGGCSYCDNTSFNPFYCTTEKSITQQINEGIAFFEKKYDSKKYIAYFQAYTNTFSNFNSLVALYSEALSHPKISGLIIGTRPDCISHELLEYLTKLSKQTYLMIEFGVETFNNHTLKIINRGHSAEMSINAIQTAAMQEISTCAHIILGLPDEKHADFVSTCKTISHLPLTSIKLHHLQILKGTTISSLFEKESWRFEYFSVDRYINLVIDFLELSDPRLVFERFISEAPKEQIISPNWQGLKNFEFVAKVEKRLIERNTWQGKYFEQ